MNFWVQNNRSNNKYSVIQYIFSLSNFLIMSNIDSKCSDQKRIPRGG